VQYAHHCRFLDRLGTRLRDSCIYSRNPAAG